MISESLVHLGEKKSGIRELFEYGLRQAAVVGKENVYDYSLGNPSVPAPEEVASMVLALANGAMRYSTGTVFDADGGFMLRRL